MREFRVKCHEPRCRIVYDVDRGHCCLEFTARRFAVERVVQIIRVIVPLAAAYQKGRRDQWDDTPRLRDDVGAY